MYHFNILHMTCTVQYALCKIQQVIYIYTYIYMREREKYRLACLQGHLSVFASRRMVPSHAQWRIISFVVEPHEILVLEVRRRPNKSSIFAGVF